MLTNVSFRKKIALVLLFTICLQIIQPLSVFALTSGPVQPESASFQSISVSDMVDLSTGDFRYNLPLMDVDGYPINLSYQAGTGMDDEASWVGLGWNVNVGAINRQLRGVPDDFSGDAVTVEHYTKPKVTVGGTLNAKFELKGGPLRFSPGVTMGIFSDSYTGVGAEIGANAGISFGFSNEGSLTAGMGAGVLANTSSGVDFSPYVSLSLRKKVSDQSSTQAGLTGSLGMNSRSGMKDLTLSTSFGISDKYSVEGKNEKKIDQSASASYNMGGSSISFNTEPISPTINIPYYSTFGSFSFEVGGAAMLAFAGGGGRGYKSTRRVMSETNRKTSFGFLYAERGKDNPNAVMDFIREKDNPAVPGMPNIAIPVATYDLFSYTNQFSSGQFRIYRGGTGSFFDNAARDVSILETDGGDVGLGGYFHGGVTHFEQQAVNRSNKWTEGNSYVSLVDFQNPDPNYPAKEHVYLKLVGEKTVHQTNYFSNQQINPLAVRLAGQNTAPSYHNGNGIPVNHTVRHYRQTEISYLTASEAQSLTSNNQLVTYPFLAYSFNPATQSAFNNPLIRNRVNTYAQGHHISAIKVTDESGKKMIYGMPVYNKAQNEYTFAVGNSYTSHKSQINMPLNGNELQYKDKGIDGYYHCEKQSPYASSFLLTEILSPDYVDVKNDGITDDDLGTAIKFNYSRIDTYRWRTPYPNDMSSQRNATLNRALLADDEDDKGSVIYGEKELYYVQSIETKNKIAYFITEDRQDGFGVQSWLGNRDLNVKQKRLKEIRLYSKHDLSKPIKTVVLNYDYILCPGTPNSISANKAKLTLTSVYFKYGNSNKGYQYPYTFDYHNAPFELRATDRWGGYKPEAQNPNGLTNEEFPYSVQNKQQADQNVQAWNLKQITLPTRGKITIDYESDSYSYVQDKKASIMYMISGVIKKDNNGNAEVLAGSNGIVDNIKSADGLRVSLEQPVPAERRGREVTQWFKEHFLNGREYLYSKLYIDVSTSNYHSSAIYDFVSSYQKVSEVKISNDGLTVDIFFGKESNANVTAFPISFAAWQKQKNEYPKYAYPGYKNKVNANSTSGALKAAISALANSFRTLSELTENFFEKAYRKSYADRVDLKKSFVRLVPVEGTKQGGGHRVKNIKIHDEWNRVSGGNSAVYGHRYEYTLEENPAISSGVASYEPGIGNDENSLKYPIKYMQKVKGGRGINNLFELEEPFGESLYPAPSVIYSRVKVMPLSRTGEPDVDKTGYSLNEYYTAKQFPVRVKATDINEFHYKPAKYYSFFKASSVEKLVFSQGYSIVVNDMHGKLKKTGTYTGADVEVNSTTYGYSQTEEGDGTFDLYNKVKIINPDGSVSDEYIGAEAEFFTDFRENVYENNGRSITLGLDVIPFFFGIPLPIPHKPTNGNSDYKLFRSASALQLVQNFGIITSLEVKQDGAVLKTENLAFDRITGEAVLTGTQNEFEDYIYSYNMPAYWTYEALGGAYKNANITFREKGININAAGKITSNGSVTDYLQEGDQLADLNQPSKRYWVIHHHTGGKSLINDEGIIVTGPVNVKAKIIESGYKNNLTAKTYSFTTQKNPLGDGNFFANISNGNLKVINASAQTYNQEWVNSVDCIEGQNRTTIRNMMHDFVFHKPDITGLDGIYGNKGTGFMFADAASRTHRKPHFLMKRLLECGLWSSIGTHNTRIGFRKEFEVPVSKIYYIGVGGDDMYSVKIDNQLIGAVNSGGYNYWDIYPVYLTAGTHTLDLMGSNLQLNSAAMLGAEIYDYNQTLSDLMNETDFSNIDILFTTATLSGDITIDSYFYRDFDIEAAIDPVLEEHYIPYIRFNPFIAGMLGTWRPYQSYKYLVDREGLKYGNTPVQRHSGFYKEFIPFWSRNQNQWQQVDVTNGSKWTLANTVTRYDKYGQELENLDPLQKYSAAVYAFQGELPAAVASNARNREIYYDSFEDVAYRQARMTPVCNTGFHKTILNVSNLVENAHTGRYSYLIQNTATPFPVSSGIIHQTESKSTKYYEFNNSGEYVLKKDRTIYPNGFEPVKRKYKISLWVKDYYSGTELLLQNKDVNLKARLATIAGVQDVPLYFKTSVDGWKLLEGDLNMSLTGDYQLSLVTLNNKSSLIDDIRIFPIEAQIKSYAYDNRNFRLMAELDENNFATFYEYDEEGSLTRIKKETERGIVTLRENRVSYRRIN